MVDYPAQVRTNRKKPFSLTVV